MNDAEYEEQKTRIQALADKWIAPLGLGWWTIKLAYARDDYEPDKKHQGTQNTGLAECNADWRYAQATITWNMPVVARQNDEELEHAFVHELTHIFLNEMRMTSSGDDWLDHEERSATMLTKAFLWALAAKPGEPEGERDSAAA